MCLSDDMHHCRMNGLIAVRHTWHTDIIGWVPFMVILVNQARYCRTSRAALERIKFILYIFLALSVILQGSEATARPQGTRAS